nr:unnamed protein product [Digitaria exilis]
MTPPGPRPVKDAYCLLNFGDSITTDHISPAGNIHPDSPAAKYLKERGVERKDFNSYGSRRGNDEIMARGTFANIRLVNKFLKGEVGPKTIHVPSGEKLAVFDAAMKYKNEGHDTIILAGAEYGSGSSRDWAAKGPMLQGVKAVIAKSFERIHRSNLAGMGIIPLCFKAGEDADTLALTGHERYTIHLPTNVSDIKPGQDVTVTTDTGKSFTCTLRFDTEVELAYYDHGGILPDREGREVPLGECTRSGSTSMAAMGHEDDDVDHYEVLCLPSGEEGAALTVEQIEKAYRTQSRLRHPDKRPDDPNATADFQLLSSSYKLLRDESLRRHLVKNHLGA